ncbi:transcriptional regulator domain-containing protein [Achromobacter xylosoxidans]|uniref:transcriptional regulator domain-containing protein n=1 Tax=Achromobacter TaxID=222 RepID=UPI000AE764C9|nr:MULTISPECIES: DUF6499 domain-containing protein [Achromobacter]
MEEKSVTKKERIDNWLASPSQQDLPPDGTDILSYQDYENWNGERWAWEFLRRNTAFQKACSLLPPSEPERKEAQVKIAREFGLRKFKDWKDAYGNGNQCPSFNPARMEIRLDGKRHTTNLNVKLHHGQAVVRLELLPALTSKKALTTQLRSVSESIEKHLNDFAVAQGKTLSSSRDTARTTVDLLRLLRLLDLNKSKKWKRADIYLNIYQDGKRRHHQENSELVELLKPRIPAAKRMTAQGYFGLINAKHLPTKKHKRDRI